MLDGIRKATQGWLGRMIMTIVLGLIIVSFVIWGVGDMFRGFVSDKVAEVGGETITAQEFQTALQTLMYQYQVRAKMSLTNAQARALGLDNQVLQRLIAETALDNRAQSSGLAISDDTIAAAVRADPNMQDAAGRFSRDRFDAALRDSGLSERGFFAAQSKTYLRQQMELALVDGLTAPKALVDALARVDAQTRAIDYVVLPPSAAGDIKAPSAEALKSYFDDRKESYRAPEYRSFTLVVASPAALAKPGEVADEDAKAVYDKAKDTRFTTPEKRKLQQIVFPNDAEADEAEAKIKAGASFDDIAEGAQPLAGRHRPWRDDQGRDVRPRDRRCRFRFAGGRRQRRRQRPVRAGDRAGRLHHAGEREALRRSRRRAEERDRDQPRRRRRPDAARQDRGRAGFRQIAGRRRQIGRRRTAHDSGGRRRGSRCDRRGGRPAGEGAPSPRGLRLRRRRRRRGVADQGSRLCSGSRSPRSTRRATARSTR